MKVLYSKEYMYRVLFVIEREGKIINCYRSSGLSGTGHKGIILPFSGLEDVIKLTNNVGYIYKEMFFCGRFIDHYKDLSRYPGIEKIMDEIKELTKDINPEPTEISTRTELAKYAKQINKEMQKIIKGKEYFDFCPIEDRKPFDWNTVKINHFV